MKTREQEVTKRPCKPMLDCDGEDKEPSSEAKRPQQGNFSFTVDFVPFYYPASLLPQKETKTQLPRAFYSC